MDDKICEFISWYSRTNGYPPTVREIGKAVGLSSSSTIHKYLKELIGKGRLTMVEKSPRTVQVK